MTDILDDARDAVNGPRQDSYGPPNEHFETVAKTWSALLGYKLAFQIEARDVPLMMAGFKLAREMRGHKRDNLVDLAGYALTADMVASEQTKEEIHQWCLELCRNSSRKLAEIFSEETEQHDEPRDVNGRTRSECINSVGTSWDVSDRAKPPCCGDQYWGTDGVVHIAHPTSGLSGSKFILTPKQQDKPIRDWDGKTRDHIIAKVGQEWVVSDTPTPPRKGEFFYCDNDIARAVIDFESSKYFILTPRIYHDSHPNAAYLRGTTRIEEYRPLRKGDTWAASYGEIDIYAPEHIEGAVRQIVTFPHHIHGHRVADYRIPETGETIIDRFCGLHTVGLAEKYPQPRFIMEVVV